jgi:phage terminase large subunit-like protein
MSPVTAYAERVLAGEIVTGRLVRLAVQRHMRDVETGADRGLRFDDRAAAKAISFFGFVQHSKGEWANTPVRLEPWEEFIIGSLFGWMRADGTRRYRISYTELGRKNGKSFLASGVGLQLAFFDGEPGAEVYAAAVKRDQAKIVWGEAARMVKASPFLRKDVQSFVANLHSEASNSKFEPLGADADSMDGLNMAGCIIDELHAHKTRAVWDVLDTATASRRQPMTFVITTAGYDRNTVCWEQHDYGIKVLEGTIEDDSFFVYIATIDEEDDWTDPAVWVKANPNLGVSVKVEDIARKVERAKLVPGQQNAVLRLHLNVWTQQANRWIDMDLWNEGGETFDPQTLAGRPCYAGLDLSSTSDMTALELFFPGEDGGGHVLSYFWLPEETVLSRTKHDRIPYEQWSREGYIEVTDGNVVDYDVIRERVRELGAWCNIREIAIDRWNSTQLQTQLMGDGFVVVPFGQGFASMAAPTKEIERQLLARTLRHGGNPVLTWHASNVAVEQDAAGNLKISKEKSSEKVDGMVALAMAVGRAMVRDGEDGRSVYETAGITVL